MRSLLSILLLAHAATGVLESAGVCATIDCQWDAAATLWGDGKKAEGVEAVHGSLAAHPGSASLRYLLAQMLEETVGKESSLQAHRAVLEVGKEYQVESGYEVGRLLRELGDASASDAAFARLLAALDSGAAANSTMGDSVARGLANHFMGMNAGDAGRMGEAMRLFRLAFEADPIGMHYRGFGFYVANTTAQVRGSSAHCPGLTSRRRRVRTATCGAPN